jgi:AcrR family transcriptional regulator
MDLPKAPWFGPRTPARRPVKQPLSQERIVDAALELVVAEGYEAVSMRRVAQALGTGAASLYAHVANKQELDQLMLDRVAAGIDVPEPDPAKWQEQLVDAMRATFLQLRSYPGLARAAIGQIPLGEHTLTSTERMIAIMRAGRLPDQVVAFAVDLLPLYVCAVAFEESVQGASEWAQEDIEKFVRELSAYFASLPKDRFPNIVSLATALTAGGGDDRFEFGLRVIVAGLASMAE